jgi:Fic family protein
VERKDREDELLKAQLAGGTGLNHRQRAALARALRDASSTFTIESHRSSHNVSYQTARNDLADLVKRGFFVVRREGRRTLLFRPAPDLRVKVSKQIVNDN